jgi:hypothetical protein
LEGHRHYTLICSPNWLGLYSARGSVRIPASAKCLVRNPTLSVVHQLKRLAGIFKEVLSGAEAPTGSVRVTTTSFLQHVLAVCDQFEGEWLELLVNRRYSDSTHLRRAGFRRTNGRTSSSRP